MLSVGQNVLPMDPLCGCHVGASFIFFTAWWLSPRTSFLREWGSSAQCFYDLATDVSQSYSVSWNRHENPPGFKGKRQFPPLVGKSTKVRLKKSMCNERYCSDHLWKIQSVPRILLMHLSWGVVETILERRKQKGPSHTRGMPQTC